MKKEFNALLVAVAVLASAQTALAGSKPDIKAGIDRCMKSYASIPLSIKEEFRTLWECRKNVRPRFFASV